MREDEENRRKLVDFVLVLFLFCFIINLLADVLICFSFYSSRKIEMEAKRKMEELERKRQEDEDLRAAVALQVG